MNVSVVYYVLVEVVVIPIVQYWGGSTCYDTTASTLRSRGETVVLHQGNAVRALHRMLASGPVLHRGPRRSILISVNTCRFLPLVLVPVQVLLERTLRLVCLYYQVPVVRQAPCSTCTVCGVRTTVVPVLRLNSQSTTWYGV
jgi:hypothetical protein